MFEDKDKQDQEKKREELSGSRHGSLPSGKG